MAGTPASLVVVISADINDFTKQLDAMTKGVDKAAKRVSDLGEKLTVGITLPLAAAATAMAKFAADSEDTSARFERVFGDASDSVKASLESIAKVVPETVDELEKLAVKTDAMLRGMLVAPQSAAVMSSAIVKLAGDLAAFNHVPIGDALQALEQGLAGRTRSLLEMGVAITKADITNEAYREGILHTGNTLTEAGTAQAAFNLIMKRTADLQGEAATTAGEQSKSWQFLARDVKELGISLGEIVLPSLVKLVDTARDAVNWVNNLSPSTKNLIVAFAGIVGVIGPLLLTVTKLAQAWVALRAAFTILSAGSGIAAFFAAISNPIGLVIAGAVALTAALGGLYLIWKKFTEGGPQFSNAPGKIIGPVTFEQIGKGLPSPKAVGGPLEQPTGDPLQQFKRHADEITQGFDAAVAHGRPVEAMLGRINSLHAEAARLLQSQGGAFTQTAAAAQEVLDKVQQITNAMALAAAASPEAQRAVLAQIAAQQKGGFNASQQAASDVAKATADQARELELRFAKLQIATPSSTAIIGQNQGGTQTAQVNPLIQFQAKVDSGEMIRAKDASLELREAMLRLPDGFNAAREASVEFGESQRAYSEDLQKRLLLSQKPAAFNAAAEAQIQSNTAVRGSANDLALRQALLTLPDGFNAAKLAAVQYAESQRSEQEQIALAFETIRIKLGPFGNALQGLSAGMQNVVVTLYNSAIGFAQSLAATIGGSGRGAATGRGIGGLLGGVIGSILPGVGTVVGAAVGGFIGTAAGGLIGGTFDKNSQSVNNNATAMDALTKTVNAVTASITNIPQFFKVETYRYQAAPIIKPAPPPPGYQGPLPPSGPGTAPGTPPDTGGGPIPGAPSGNVIFTGPVTFALPPGSAKQQLDDLHEQILKRRATGSSARLSFAGGLG